MEEYKKIILLENEVEAGLLQSELEQKKILFNIITYHDIAYDGIFQAQKGWGFVEAPERFREEIINIYQDLIQEDKKEMPE